MESRRHQQQLMSLFHPQYGPQIEWLDEPLRKRAHFFPYGIASKDGHVDGTPFYTLKTLMKMNGHDWIDIRQSMVYL